MGYLGFREYAFSASTGDTALDSAYRTIQLFVLESGYVQGNVPWQLEIARVLAPVVPAWAALQALLFLFRDQREAWRLRRRKDHVVVCGLGRKGMQLVRDFRSAGENVVAIERDEDNLYVAACRSLGAQVLTGNCTDRSLLRNARVDRARYVIIVTGDDGTNVETAVLTCQLVRERSRRIRGIVRCYVHVVALRLCQLLERHDLLSSPDEKFEARMVNSFLNSARSLLTAHPLEPVGFGERDPRVVHLIIFGFGKMGESVAVQAAKLGHFANDMRLRITVIDEHALDRQASFANRYPGIDKVCDVAFVSGKEENLDVQSRLAIWAADPEAITSIAVCFDGDSAVLACALNVMSTLQTAVHALYVRMSEESGLATLFAERTMTPRWSGRVHTFSMTSHGATRDLLLDRDRDILARAFHRDYVAKRKQEGKPDATSSMQDWDRLGVDLRDSNRQMADHLPVKLRAIGCDKGASAKAPRLTKFTEEDVELLARMEHARWCAERRIAGWTTGVTNPDEKTSAHLVEWKDLEEDIREYDRQAVRCIPGVLELIDEHVYRVTEFAGE